MSRFRVARILEKALRDGIVRIEFSHPAGHVQYDLSSALKTRFGLKNAIVVDDHGGDVELILDSMGEVAAALLREISGPQEVLGFAWTRVLEAMSRHLKPLQAKAIVQLGGAWPGAGTSRTSVDLVRDLAVLTRGRAYTFYAPLVASDAHAAEAIRRQPDVLAAKAMFSAVTLAIVGLGAWREGASSLWPALSPEARARVTARGAVAEICGMTLDGDGRPVATDLSEMSIGISAEELSACPDVLALAFGTEKTAAILAAIRGGVVKSLITHAAVARALLDGPAAA
nr:sugar-binding domain-containing protein [Jiella sonneratiae]